MSILFYLLVAFTVMDINVLNSAHDWMSISRAYVGAMFFVFLSADFALIKNEIGRLRK